MDIEINLRNRHYPWNHLIHDASEYWWKGQIFFQDKLINFQEFKENIFLNQKSSEYDIKKNIEILNKLNGSFLFIVETSNSVLCVVDRIRSIPLFYSSYGNQLLITDDANYLRNRINASLNEEPGAEFFVTGYVTGPDTLFNGISQLQAGEFLLFNKLTGDYAIHRYFHYLHGDYSTDSEEQLLALLDKVMLSVFSRLIETTVNQGKKIVVPLSGGLDSRIIVAMLKRLGVDDVICYSYGKKGNIEAEISRKVAESLGYTWHFVEYTSRRWYDCYHSDEMRAYERYAANLTSLPHIQDFLAVKILKEEGKIPYTAVFIPGHSGDMLAGSWIPNNIENLPHTAEYCINHSLQRHYSLWEWNNKNKKMELLFQERIRKSIGNISIYDADSLANGIEYFNFKERQAKFIVNSVRVYEFFGFEWRIPLWDAELIDFFLKIPLNERIHTAFYKKYAVVKLFINQLSQLLQIDCTTPLYLPPKIGKRKKLVYLLNQFHFTLLWHSIFFRNPIFLRFTWRIKVNPIFNRLPSLLKEITIRKKGLIKYIYIPSINGFATLEYYKNVILQNEK